MAVSTWDREMDRLTANADPATIVEFERLRASQPEEDVDSDEPGELSLLRSELIHGADITTIPPPEPLVEGLLDLDSVAVFFGAPGGGKTFAAIDVAAGVASGTPWQGRQTVTGGVLYVAAEGLGGLGMRVRAWQQYQDECGRSADISRLKWLPRAVNLLEPRWLDALTELAAEVRPVLVVIDTLARSMAGGEENSAKDMGRVVEAADRLRRAAGSCVLLVHHVGKDTAKGMRGSNSLEGGVDTAWEVAREHEWLSLNCHRQKNHATAEKPISLAMANIAGSIVLVPDTRHPADSMHDSYRTTLLALDQVDTGGGTSTSVWWKSSELPEKTFYNHRKRLLELGLIVNVGTVKQPKYALTDEGRSCLPTATTAK